MRFGGIFCPSPLSDNHWKVTGDSSCLVRRKRETSWEELRRRRYRPGAKSIGVASIPGSLSVIRGRALAEQTSCRIEWGGVSRSRLRGHLRPSLKGLGHPALPVLIGIVPRRRGVRVPLSASLILRSLAPAPSTVGFASLALAPVGERSPAHAQQLRTSLFPTWNLERSTWNLSSRLLPSFSD